MKILINNAILYTSETPKIGKVKTIKNCMIYDLCLAFMECGHEVTLAAAKEYMPVENEKYPFEIIWMKTYLKRLFIPNKIPFNIQLINLIKKNKYDLIISSEVFSLNTLCAVLSNPKNTIVWQEMAFHQKMAKHMASKLWHNTVVKIAMKNTLIIPRSIQAKKFISKYSANVSNEIIPHGINLKKFIACNNKKNYFVVCSQLIKRKQIHNIIKVYKNFIEKTKLEINLYIIGDGNERENLEQLVKNLGLSSFVIFTGKLNHELLTEYLRTALALLVFTKKDNSMISIAESIVSGTPVITTSIPNNAFEIKKYNLGIVNDNWNTEQLEEIVNNNNFYVKNCINYKSNLDNKKNVKKFISIFERYKQNGYISKSKKNNIS